MPAPPRRARAARRDLGGDRAVSHTFSAVANAFSSVEATDVGSARASGQILDRQRDHAERLRPRPQELGRRRAVDRQDMVGLVEDHPMRNSGGRPHGGHDPRTLVA